MRAWLGALALLVSGCCRGPSFVESPNAPTEVAASSERPGDSSPENPVVVRLPTSDGLIIEAELTEAEDPIGAVVLVHMLGRNRLDWRPLVPALSEAGLTVLALDLRGHGGSRIQGDDDLGMQVYRPNPELFFAMSHDVTAAARWLASRGVSPEAMALVGASVGGPIVLDAANHLPHLKALVLMTPSATLFDKDTAADLAPSPPRPTLVLTSREEQSSGPESVARGLGRTAELRVLDERGVHGTQMLGVVPDLERDIAAWIRGQLAP